MDTLPRLHNSQLSLRKRVATLTFRRHDVRNALTGTRLVDDLVATVDWINASVEKEAAEAASGATPDVNLETPRVLVITGEGSAFCGGGNIKEMAARSGDFAGTAEELTAKYKAGIQRMPLAMQRLKVPVIAAVNGPAIGAGFDLCNMCDLRIASERAKFGETFVNLGLIPGDGGAWYLQRLIGYQRAAELTFTGRVINADEAQEYGITLKTVTPALLLDEAQTLAETLASKPSFALQMGKQLMRQAQTQPLDEFLDACGEVQGLCHHHPEHLLAVESVLASLKK